jgi:hypothetical protein
MILMLAIYKASLILLVGLTLVFVFQGFYPDLIGPFSNAVSPLIAGLAVASSVLPLKKYWHKIGERFSIIWFFFTAGLAFWFLGEAGWAVYTFVLNVEVPYPSIADVFWLIGYIPLFIGFYLYVRIFATALTRKALIVSLAVTIILAFSVSVAVIIPLMGTEPDLITMVVDVAYPLSDLSLFCVSILGLLIFFGGNLGKSWAFINGAIILNTFADVLFSYVTKQGTYYAGHPVDLLFIYAYMFFLLAFHVHVNEL